MSIFKREGRIDVLVNNAGVVFNKKIGMIVRPETEQMFRVNVIAVIEMVQLVSRLMARNGGGSIVNIASVTAVLGSPGQSAYSATKGAIMSFTKSAAKELAPLGIRVNAVAPGIVEDGTIRLNCMRRVVRRLIHVFRNRFGTFGYTGRCGERLLLFLPLTGLPIFPVRYWALDGCASI